jgi:hypothetical protein
MLRIRRVIAVVAPLLVVVALATPPASADNTRQHTCEQAGGTFRAGTLPGLDRCVVVVQTSVNGPFGAPTTTLSEPRPDHTSPIFVDGPTTPTGAPTTEDAHRDVGEPTEATTVVPGVPTATAERTEQGTPTDAEAPGTRNCRTVYVREQPVERCERTVVTTTTTPTTVHTTVTTPQTERTVITQARQTCSTTTQPTSFVRTTTQGQVQDRTISYRQRSITTTTTTTYGFTARHAMRLVVFASGAPNPRTAWRTAPADPWVQTTTVPIQPSSTVETLPGESIVTGPTCTPADAVTTTTEREVEPLTAETSRPGEPIVTTSTRGTGQTCFINPITALQRLSPCA